MSGHHIEYHGNGPLSFFFFFGIWHNLYILLRNDIPYMK